MSEEQALILQHLPVTLTTARVQRLWPSGKKVREWADRNRVIMTMRKGFVDLKASDKPESKSTIVDEVNKVAEKVKDQL